MGDSPALVVRSNERREGEPADGISCSRQSKSGILGIAGVGHRFRIKREASVREVEKPAS